MRIQNKILLSITITFSILFCIVYILSDTIFLQSFLALEEKQTRNNIERVENTLARETEDLVAFLSDWAAWDDTYQFITDGNQEYIKANVVDSSFEDARLDFIIYVNRQNQLVYGKQYDFANETQVELSAELLKHLIPGSILLRPELPEQAFGGIIKIKNDFFIIASYPIMDSNREGDPRGVLLMGRKLDRRALERLSKTTQIDVKLHDIEKLTGGDKLIAEEIIKSAKPKIDYVNDELVITNIMFGDIYEMPAFLIEVRDVRDIYIQGIQATSYMVIVLIVSAVTIAIILMFVIQKMVTSRISTLEDTVKSVEQTGDISLRVKNDKSNDELAMLATRINGMLESLQITQDQLESARAESDRASVAKSEFLTSMSHELRTPLNAILGYSQLLELRANNLNESEKMWATEITTAGGYLLDLISELLELSSIESGSIELDVKPLLISEIIVKAVNIAQPVASQFNVELVVEADELEGLKLNLDEMRMQQILINLLTNAIKYNKENGSVRLFGAIIGKYCYIKVEDNGRGIPKEKLEIIFDPFQRLNDNGVDGIGIGLSITRRLVEAMNGRIDVKSKLDLGSVFTIVLPAA